MRVIHGVIRKTKTNLVQQLKRRPPRSIETTAKAGCLRRLGFTLDLWEMIPGHKGHVCLEGKKYKGHTPCHVTWKLVIANPPLLPTWKKRCFSIEDYRVTIERFASQILILNTNRAVTCLQLFQEWSPWRAVIPTQNTWRQKRLDLMQNCWNFYRWLEFKPLWRSMKSCLVHKYPCNSFYTPWTNVFRPWKRRQIPNRETILFQTIHF